MYWFVVLSLQVGAVPLPVGPFPTYAVCQTAGHALIPEDRQFWTIDQLDAAERRETANAKYEQAQIQRTTPEDNWIGLSVCAWVKVNANKHVIARMDRCFHPTPPPAFQILSGCEASR